ncbi:14699_t:CDS:2 [Cetraspora pellucida]|uniref:14699_t:CDS:1 n=1 Tax=Cetraspora pellucida TaxID=1433469 RepID=A0A9N9D5G4_9GLOM|nr:14699_t:CDS:2 [Cetraspora pellucida]
MFLQLPDIKPLLSENILSKFKHTFLIRDPEKSVKSFYRSINKSNNKKLNFDRIGIEELRKLYDIIKNTINEEILLIDADDLVENPEKILRKYCENVNIKFRKEMLIWKPQKMDIWKNNYLWHKNAMESTKFELKFDNNEIIEYPQSVYNTILFEKPHYDYLYQYKTKF